ncbi:DegV family protein [Peribacillus acanthi]|uniref:DegV family protein n=1 Tax=Peribacillus acanthi TaxID=2171554 RepID=UPI000D3E1292|nr:DegV family protein [Peribacillus acanthi]
MNVHILADSASDLPYSYFEQKQLPYIPLLVHLDGKDYEDGLTIQSISVYDAMRNGSVPKTSQASPEYMHKLFTQLAEEKKQGVYIAFSSELSGTYNTAVMIRNEVKETYPDLDLEIIDSKCASLGYGLVVKVAANLAAKGAKKEEIVKAVEFHCTHMESLFTVDELEYLARGGRISKASALVGGLLNIKPLLHVEEGKLVPLDKIRGKKKLLKKVLDLMHERGEKLQQQTIGISHADDLETALEWKEAISQEFGATHFEIEMIGSAIGAHVGPGTIALFFLNKLPE